MLTSTVTGANSRRCSPSAAQSKRNGIALPARPKKSAKRTTPRRKPAPPRAAKRKPAPRKAAKVAAPPALPVAPVVGEPGLPFGFTYAHAGVNISTGDRVKQRIKYLAQRTFTRSVLGDIGGFGGLFKLDTTKWPNPVLVSSADGVGTKLKLAFELGTHHTVGADLVNHCVNDIAVQGATPLFFLDYFAAGELDMAVAEKVVSGLADACHANGCALIGGETAQMPGFYRDGEY